MDWPTLKKDLTQELHARLEAYRKEISPIWGNDKRSLAMQAMWTVWWQRGKNPAQIRIKNSSLGRPEVSRVNIQTGIQSFARSIGLTLQRPKPRAGHITSTLTIHLTHESLFTVTPAHHHANGTGESDL